MEETIQLQSIIEKLKKGMLFGLFENGDKCYFQDGVRVSYTELWIAIRKYYNLPIRHNNTLTEVCKELFVGNHSYKFSQHKWARK
jgi:hypothetical protein